MAVSPTQEFPNRVNSNGSNAVNGPTTGVDLGDATILTHTGSNHYAYFPGEDDNNLTVPDEAALDITDDLELVFRAALDDWTAGSSQTLLSKSAAAYEVFISGTGVLRLVLNSTTYSSTVVPTLVDGTAYWIKITRDRSTGDIDYSTAADAATEPSSWDAVGTTVAGTTDAIATNGVSLYVGSDEAGATPTGGIIHRVIVRAAIDGADVLDVNLASDIDTTTDPDAGQTSFTATTGQTVTVNRATSGLVTAIVTRHVALLDGSDDYIQLPADAPTPTFTATTGDYTVVVLFRSQITGTNRVLWSSQSAATDGAHIFVNASGNFIARVYGATTNAADTLGVVDDGTMKVVALVQNSGTIYGYIGTGLGSGASTTGVGTITHQQPRIGARADFVGNVMDVELFDVITYQNQAKTEAELDVIAADLLAGNYS